LNNSVSQTETAGEADGKGSAPATDEAAGGLATVPSQIAQIQRDLAEIKRLIQSRGANLETGYLDAKAAAAYCGMSRGTFDKYRYKSAIKIKGYPIDGKILYKREDLDGFIKLYDVKSRGLA
jgi:hypothetical protein